MSRKKALITGVTGQDGAYLARILLDKGYEVHGMKRRASSFNTQRIDGIYADPHEGDTDFFMHYGDMTDSSNIMRLVQSIEPDEVYNLAAQSHVQVSFETAEYTANADAFGTLRFLEAIRTLGLTEKTRFYQASTSELYGKVQEVPQSETTPFYPRSPYAVAKLYAYWICVNYREAYGMHASNGILFNHESPMRGETFVTQKIAMAAANIETSRKNFIWAILMPNAIGAMPENMSKACTPLSTIMKAMISYWPPGVQKQCAALLNWLLPSLTARLSGKAKVSKKSAKMPKPVIFWWRLIPPISVPPKSTC